MTEKKIFLTRPDDMHLHLREAQLLESVISWSTALFGRAIIMPNLKQPITTIKRLISYRNQILSSIPKSHSFIPLMTLYLTENTKPDEISLGVEKKVLSAVKLYPVGATTNSGSGVLNINKCFSVFERMIQLKVPLLIHGEVADPQIDIFDRESEFISTILDPLRKTFPDLRIVLEHITTTEAVEYVLSSKGNLAATITPHHLALNRTDIFRGGINPHNFCLPILKKEQHRLKLIDAATSGDSRFFLGTDSAPHLVEDKENNCGCAGIFNAPNVIGVLATIFEKNGKLDNLEMFTSVNGANFYELGKNQEKIMLYKKEKPIKIRKFVPVGESCIKVFDPNFDVCWDFKNF